MHIRRPHGIGHAKEQVFLILNRNRGEFAEETDCTPLCKLPSSFSEEDIINAKTCALNFGARHCPSGNLRQLNL